MAKPTHSRPKLQGTLTPQDVPITNPHNLSAVYANHFGVSATMTDFTIYFLEMGQLPSGSKAATHKQEVKAIVTLPVMAAAGMIQVLQKTLEAHSATMKELQKQMSSDQ